MALMRFKSFPFGLICWTVPRCVTLCLRAVNFIMVLYRLFHFSLCILQYYMAVGVGHVLDVFCLGKNATSRCCLVFYDFNYC